MVLSYKKAQKKYYKLLQFDFEKYIIVFKIIPISKKEKRYVY